MKKANLLVVAFALMLTMVGHTFGQNAAVTSTVVVSMSGPFPDPCTNELVDYSGTIELTQVSWTDANGGVHLRTSASQLNVDGVGETSQLDYHLLANGNQVENTGPGGLPWETTSVFRFAINGEGAAPNAHMLTMFHQTVNADGSTTAEIDQNTVKCNGK